MESECRAGLVRAEQAAENDLQLGSLIFRMIFSWAACTINILVSNLSCFALSSFFFSILPTKRNLLTYLDTILVLSITAAVNVMVGGVISLANLTSLQKILMECHVVKAESRLQR